MPRRHLSQLGLAGSAPPPPPEAAKAAHGYPRPMLRRASWTSLNGEWDFAIDADGVWHAPADVTFDARILVPVAPETRRSGIADSGLYRVVWYRRKVHGSVDGRGRSILHFGAVDSGATVWVDGVLVGNHEGGYTTFSFDVTDVLRGGGEHEVVVRAEDDQGDLAKPRGKQDWQLLPHSIWYPRTTVIWQTVWLEEVPPARIERLRWVPNLERWEVAIEAFVVQPSPALRLRLSVKLRCASVVLADDVYLVVAGEVNRRISLSDPGIDDFRNELLWSPASAKLIDAELRLLDDAGNVLDEVFSYTALRSFAVDGDRLMLNGRPYPLRMVLDQGYWADAGLTAPDDTALRRDVELTKAMGFNGARKHQKIEDPRYLFWADRLGLLVWEEMPSAYRFTKRSVERLTREWMAVVGRDVSHPCIVAWVPFNESWGVPNLPDSKPERDYVQALYHLTRTLDPIRPVIGNDGWESVATDIIGIHDYDESPERIGRRYAAHDVLPRLLARERPGGRVLVIEGHEPAGKVTHPIVLSEFGGIAYAGEDGSQATWGCSRTASSEELAGRYAALLSVVRSLQLLSGFCYTQFSDTYQEANGLLYANREPKSPFEHCGGDARRRASRLRRAGRAAVVRGSGPHRARGGAAMTTPAASPAPAFYRRRLPKPDGRALFLCARQPISEDIRATCPRDDAPVPPNPHLRWHLVRGEWVAYAGHRQNRTFLPPAEFNPLAPTTDPHNPTELPSGGYDAAVFENRFPTLYAGAHDPPSALVPTLPARGASEVVVYAQDPRASLGTLPLDHVGLVIDAWADRYDELGARDGVAYVFPFENRGVEVGVTLHQPHGQIYAYPFVPPVAARELEQQRAHYAQTGRGLLEDYARDERADGRRILQVTDTVVSVVPVCARNAYEMWILPARPAPSLSALNPAERRDFARALSTAVRTLDALWGRPMPYVLVIHQAPTDGLPHPEAHVDAEVYPAYRMPSRLKYLAGSELGAGTFTADTLPEDKAVELRAAGGAS